MSGVRRAGKSVLFQLYKEELLTTGVDEDQIISINFEDLSYYDLRHFQTLFAYIKERLVEEKTYYIFLDEIQHVEKFELVADSLFILPNVDLYLTGSNAYFMSSQLATNLTGRYVEIEVLPLSFEEYLSGQSLSENLIQQKFLTIISLVLSLTYCKHHLTLKKLTISEEYITPYC